MKKIMFNITAVIMSAMLLSACGESSSSPATYPDPDNPAVTVCEGYIPEPYTVTAYSGENANVLSDGDAQAVWKQINSLINGSTPGEVIDLDIYEENLDEYKQAGRLFELGYEGDYSIEEYDNLFDAIVFIFDDGDLIYGYRTKTDDGAYDEKIPAYYVIRGDEYSERLNTIEELVFGQNQ